MKVTMNLNPELEARLSAHARAAGMTLEAYLQRLIEKELATKMTESGPAEGSGMVWENGLLIYGVGTPLPAGSIDHAVSRSREERSQHLLARND